jgi:hypothetical protein
MENRIVDGKNILELMRRESPEDVIEDHPDNFVEMYVRKGAQQGWVF